MKKTLFLAGSGRSGFDGRFGAAPTAKMKAAVADPGRPAADTARDENRKPAEMLAFAGIRPGKVVVDMLPGAGYFTRIFAKAVEPSGRVYAYFGTQYDARLKSQNKDPDNQFADLKADLQESGRDPWPAAAVRHARGGGYRLDLGQLSRHAQQGLCHGRE